MKFYILFLLFFSTFSVSMNLEVKSKKMYASFGDYLPCAKSKNDESSRTSSKESDCRKIVSTGRDEKGRCSNLEEEIPRERQYLQNDEQTLIEQEKQLSPLQQLKTQELGGLFSSVGIDSYLSPNFHPLQKSIWIGQDEKNSLEAFKRESQIVMSELRRELIDMKYELAKRQSDGDNLLKSLFLAKTTNSDLSKHKQYCYAEFNHMHDTFFKFSHQTVTMDSGIRALYTAEDEKKQTIDDIKEELSTQQATLKGLKTKLGKYHEELILVRQEVEVVKKQQPQSYFHWVLSLFCIVESTNEESKLKDQ